MCESGSTKNYHTPQAASAPKRQEQINLTQNGILGRYAANAVASKKCSRHSSVGLPNALQIERESRKRQIIGLICCRINCFTRIPSRPNFTWSGFARERVSKIFEVSSSITLITWAQRRLNPVAKHALIEQDPKRGNFSRNSCWVDSGRVPCN